MILECTRPCTKDAYWCKKNVYGVTIVVSGTSGDYIGTPGAEGNCTYSLNLTAVNEVNGNTFYCAPDCSQFLCSHMVPIVLHVQGTQPFLKWRVKYLTCHLRYCEIIHCGSYLISHSSGCNYFRNTWHSGAVCAFMPHAFTSPVGVMSYYTVQS